jgi:hypothetical protein
MLEDCRMRGFPLTSVPESGVLGEGGRRLAASDPAMGRVHARIHVEHDASRLAATMHKVDPLAGQLSNSREVLGCREPLHLERPIWLGEAAQP